MGVRVQWRLERGGSAAPSSLALPGLALAKCLATKPVRRLSSSFYARGPEINIRYFPDADCTEGLFPVPLDAEVSAAGTFLIASTTTNAAAIFGLGKKISAPAQTWEVNGDECVEAAVVEDQAWYETKAYAPAEFVAVTREVE